MGYTTTFEGSFRLDRRLADEHARYLEQFAGTRRMKRDPRFVEKMADPVREAAGLPVGDEGGYFVAGGGDDRGLQRAHHIVYKS